MHNTTTWQAPVSRTG